MTNFRTIDGHLPRLRHLAAQDPRLAGVQPEQVDALLDIFWGVFGENGHSTDTLVDTVHGMISHRIQPAVGFWRLMDRDGDTSDQGVRRLGEAMRVAAIEVLAHLEGQRTPPVLPSPLTIVDLAPDLVTGVGARALEASVAEVIVEGSLHVSDGTRPVAQEDAEGIARILVWGVER